MVVEILADFFYMKQHPRFPVINKSRQGFDPPFLISHSSLFLFLKEGVSD